MAIMILFMAMPLMFGLFNIVVPLANRRARRRVSVPELAQLLDVLLGAMLFNVSFVIGGSPDAGWLSLSAAVGDVTQSGRRTKLLYLGDSNIRVSVVWRQGLTLS